MKPQVEGMWEDTWELWKRAFEASPFSQLLIDKYGDPFAGGIPFIEDEPLKYPKMEEFE